MLRIILFCLTVLISLPAQAESVSIATVDIFRTMEEVNEFQAAQQRLQTMFQGKQAELQQMEAGLQSLVEEYQAKGALLGEAGRQEYQQRIMQAQGQYEQAYMTSQQEMQQAEATAMQPLMAKVKSAAEAVAKEQGYTLVLEVSQGGVLYAAPSTDITGALIQRLNQ